jgi:hypothetical protein
MNGALGQIAAELDALDAVDPESMHGRADELLMRALRELGDTQVVDAYKRCQDRCPWWAFA